MSPLIGCIWLGYLPLFCSSLFLPLFCVIFILSVASLCFLLLFLFSFPPFSPLIFYFLSICPLLHFFPPTLSIPIPPSLYSVPILSQPPHPPNPLPPSLPTVGKWPVARVLAWTGTRLIAVALPGPNSPAPVVMWTSSRLLPRQHHLLHSLPSTSIRKMDEPPSLSLWLETCRQDAKTLAPSQNQCSSPEITRNSFRWEYCRWIRLTLLIQN